MAVKRMQAVKKGNLSHPEAKASLEKVCNRNRSELITYLTRHYSSDADAFQYFGLL